jgi:outer membrane lipopolysaccharide assembly protein LptE/RlpB
MSHSRTIAYALLSATVIALAGCGANATAGGTTPVAAPQGQTRSQSPTGRTGRALTTRVQVSGVAVRRVAPFMERVAAPAHLAYVADFNANFIGDPLAGR